MRNPVERCLEPVLTAPFYFGEVLVRKTTNGHFVLSHRDDKSVDELQIFRSAEDASKIAKYDDTGNYRPLKTAPNLCHGWRLELDTLEDLRRSLDYFYPGRLAIFAAWKNGRLQTTALRETLDRQSGMYRVAEKFPIRSLTILLRTSAAPMVDVCEPFCGNATKRERLHLPSCRRKSLILDSIR